MECAILFAFFAKHHRHRNSSLVGSLCDGQMTVLALGLWPLVGSANQRNPRPGHRPVWRPEREA